MKFTSKNSILILGKHAINIGDTSIIISESEDELIIALYIPNSKYLQFALAALSILNPDNNLNSFNQYINYPDEYYYFEPYNFYYETYEYVERYEEYDTYLNSYVDFLYTYDDDPYWMYEYEKWIYQLPYHYDYDYNYNEYDAYPKYVNYSRSIYSQINSEGLKSLIERTGEKMFITGTDDMNKRFCLSTSCPTSIKGKVSDSNSFQAELIIKKINLTYQLSIVKSL